MKYIFILASHANTNHIKRIEEFYNRGYNVEVYSFYRDEDKQRAQMVVPFQNIGTFSNNTSYYKRISIMLKGIRRVLKQTREEECIYYLMRNDVALLYTLVSSKPYIFEEADMTHLDFNNGFIRNALENRIKTIIKHSVLSVFRSEGFVRFHFPNEAPDNVCVIPNRLHPQILSYPALEKKPFDINHLRFAFVGVIRFDSVFEFAKIILSEYPQHEFHFYGGFVTKRDEEKFSSLKEYTNCFFHGAFSSPKDLPNIYENVDILLATYDNWMINICYAEPNKLYESIYFHVPIVVSRGTFLAEKVKRLDVGFEVDAMDNKQVKTFVNSISLSTIEEKVNACKAFNKDELINKNDTFFELLEAKSSELKK